VCHPRGGAGCEANRVDLVAIERDHPGALMGCVLLDPTREDFTSASDAGLAMVETEAGEYVHRRTPNGGCVRAALRSLLLHRRWDDAVAYMLHAVGNDPAGPPGETRNRFIATHNGPEAATWHVLLEHGLAEEGERINDKRDRVFCVSSIGRAALALHDTDPTGATIDPDHESETERE
jgi:hypothetical protein